MRVKTLTLTTASAAALTIGLASPAFALATAAGELGAVHQQAGFGVQHQAALHSGLHHMVALPKGDDDDGDDDGDGDGGGGSSESSGSHRHFGGPRGLCGVGGHIGGLAQGCGEEENGDDDDDEGGQGDHGSESSNACCEHGGHVRVSRPAPAAVAPAPRHHMVPMGAVHSGFGGTQGMNAPLGLAGLSLLVGGAGLLPLARRRLQASARS
jgi:hypothetical protein